MQTAKSSANINLLLYMSIMSRKANLLSLSPRQHTIVTVFLAGSFPNLRLYSSLYDYVIGRGRDGRLTSKSFLDLLYFESAKAKQGN